MSSNVTVRHLTNPSDADLEKYSESLAEAFHYSFFASGLGNKRELQVPILKAHLAAAVLEGELHVAEIPGTGPVGFAAWFGPGQKFLSTDAQRNAGWNQLMAQLTPELQQWWDNFLREYDELCEGAHGPGVKLGTYHLQLLGVHPSAQRKGVAAALTRFAEDKARAARAPTTLETVGDLNFGIYKNMGYEVAGSGPISAWAPGQSFTMFVFIKHTEKE